MKRPNEWMNSINRRSFLIGLTGAALPAVPAVSSAVSRVEINAAEQSVTAKSEQDALFDIMMIRFGSYLKSDETAMVRRGLERIGRMSAELHKVRLHNGEAPDCLFHPDGR